MNGLGLRGSWLSVAGDQSLYVQLHRESAKKLLSSASVLHSTPLLSLAHCLLSDRAPPAAPHHLHSNDTDL